MVQGVQRINVRLLVKSWPIVFTNQSCEISNCDAIAIDNSTSIGMELVLIAC